MSHIFDALQKAESEAQGPVSADLSTATELLERAERRAVEQWKAEKSQQTEGEFTQQAPAPAARMEDRPLLVMPLADPAASIHAAGAPGPIPDFATADVHLPSESRLVSVLDKESAAAEAFRLLSVRLRRLRKERPLSRLLITSTVPQEGKSFTAANLACTIASATKQRTLLVDGDLRRASSVEVLGMKPLPGLTEWLQGKQDLTSSIYRLSQPGIWILPPGAGSANPLELLQIGALTSLMSQLNRWFDWIIIDSPPILPMADTTVWARLADGILLVARRGFTHRKLLKKGLSAIEPDKLIGAVLNSSSASGDAYENYYYYRKPVSEETEVSPTA